MEGEGEKVRYTTSDIYFAAFMAALDIPLECTENEFSESGKKKVVFVFRIPKNHREQLKKLFFSGTGTVHALKFVNLIRSFKQMCFI